MWQYWFHQWSCIRKPTFIHSVWLEFIWFIWFRRESCAWSCSWRLWKWSSMWFNWRFSRCKGICFSFFYTSYLLICIAFAQQITTNHISCNLLKVPITSYFILYFTTLEITCFKQKRVWVNGYTRWYTVLNSTDKVNWT